MAYNKTISTYTIKILNQAHEIMAQDTGENEAKLVYQSEYAEGDIIVLETSAASQYAIVQVDDALGSSFVYLQEEQVVYTIPFNEKKVSYSPKAFSGGRHYLYIRDAEPFEIDSYKNLALNVNDQHIHCGMFPHASANVETRGESVFAARNAIDGVRENRSHGQWPFQSWGINKQDDAAIHVEFGRKIITNRIVMYTRADFPHDNWWEKVTLEFSDGTEIVWDLQKSYKPHVLNMPEKTIEWVRLKNLIKSDGPSPFPSLTQLEVYGRECK